MPTKKRTTTTRRATTRKKAVKKETPEERRERLHWESVIAYEEEQERRKNAGMSYDNEDEDDYDRRWSQGQTSKEEDQEMEDRRENQRRRERFMPYADKNPSGMRYRNLDGLSGVMDTLPKKFQNSFTKLTNNATNETFKIGDYVVASPKARGFIVALGTNVKGAADGTFYLSDTSVVEFKKIKHAEPPTPPFYMRPHKKKSPPTEQSATAAADCQRVISENIVLKRKLAECEGALSAAARQLPPTAAGAPPHVKEILPEIRQEELTQEIELQVEELAQITQTGTAAEIKEAEKNIQESIKELKEVAAQTTISATAGCRVILSTAKSRTGETYGTVRIYFATKPDKEMFNVLARNGYRSFMDKEVSTKGNAIWYFGCKQDAAGKKLEFARQICNQAAEPQTGEEQAAIRGIYSKHRVRAKASL